MGETPTRHNGGNDLGGIRVGNGTSRNEYVIVSAAKRNANQAKQINQISQECQKDLVYITMIELVEYLSK